jgi:hypothetical protein
MRRRTARILSAIAVVIVALGVLYGIAVGISAHRLRQAYAALQRDGRPMSVAEITPPNIPNSENAALFYESAALLLKAQPVSESDLMKLSADYVRGNADPNRAGELERLLQSDVVGCAVEIARQGAQRPSCRLDCDYAAGLSMRFQSVSLMRNLAWVLAAKACLESKAGHADTAWRTVHTQLRLANALRNEPMISGQLVRFASLDASWAAIQMLCRAAPPTFEQARDVEEAFGDYASMAPLVLAADGERLIFGEQVFSLPKSELRQAAKDFLEMNRLPLFLQRLLYWRVKFKPLFLADHATYLDWNRKGIRLLEDPNFLDKTLAFEKELSAAEKHHILTSMRAPTLVRPAIFQYRLVANIRITLTGLALLQYGQSHGGLPESLDALGGRNVEDPFSKKPLVYRREGSGFVLYSVGDDREDNGGMAKPKKGDAKHDIVWRYPGPAPAMNRSNQ